MVLDTARCAYPDNDQVDQRPFTSSREAGPNDRLGSKSVFRFCLFVSTPPAVTLGLEPRALYFGISARTLCCGTTLEGDLRDEIVK
ncbi:hypothetical protein D3C87_1721240 [compost metagenome]